MKFWKNVAAKYWVFMALLSSYLRENNNFFNKKEFKKQAKIATKTIDSLLSKYEEWGKIKVSWRKIEVLWDVMTTDMWLILER